MKYSIPKLMHFLAGVIVILHALDEMESANRSTLFYLVSGVLMLTMAFFQENMEKRNPVFAAVCYWIEAVILGFIGMKYFESYKHYLPWIYLVVCIFYLLAGYEMLTRKVKPRKR